MLHWVGIWVKSASRSELCENKLVGYNVEKKIYNGLYSESNLYHNQKKCLISALGTDYQRHVHKLSPIAKKIWLSIHLRNFGSHMTVRPSDHPSAPQGNQCELSHYLPSMETLQPDIAHPRPLWSIDSCQNRVSPDQYHMTILQA